VSTIANMTTRFREQLGLTASNADIPTHVTSRMLVFLGEEIGQLPWVDATNQRVDGGGARGEAVVFTNSLVVYAKWDTSAGEAGSSVDVEMWSRHLLRSVALISWNSQVNLDVKWRDSVGWPLTGQLSLFYRGRQDPLNVPLDPTKELGKDALIRPFIHSLMTDLRESR
jgi:hypothetical protein